jgi:DNA polymerase I-like protein with 3'-5' exonuclease and polymerase domains
MTKSGYVSFSTEIYNLPISGFATGEIIPIALVHFWHRIKRTRAKIFNTVHDSMIVYNHKEEIGYVTDIAKIAMTHDVYRFLKEVYKYEFKVPLGLGMKTGSHWGDTDTEHKWDVWPSSGEERYQIEQNKQLKLIHDTRSNN